jgi:hypothetical protein
MWFHLRDPGDALRTVDRDFQRLLGDFHCLWPIDGERHTLGELFKTWLPMSEQPISPTIARMVGCLVCPAAAAAANPQTTMDPHQYALRDNESIRAITALLLLVSSVAYQLFLQLRHALLPENCRDSSSAPKRMRRVGPTI